MTVHEILSEHFLKKKKVGCSLRSLSRDLGISPSFLSNVFKGKKRLPLKLLPSLSRLLDLDSETTLEIQRQSMPPGSVDPLLFKAPTATANWEASPIESFSIVRQWFYVAIMDLTGCTDFDGTQESIARRLGLALPTVELAIRELIRANFLHFKDGKLAKTNEFVRLSSSISRSEIREFHRQMLKKANDELKHTSPSEFERRLVTGITITASPEKIIVAKKMLNDALHEIAHFLGSDGGNQVYHLAAQLFPLTK